VPTTLAVDLTDLDTFVRGVPHDQFDLLRAEAPVYFHPETNGAGFWCITRADDLHTVSQAWEVFSSEWGITLHEAESEEQLEQQRMMMLMMDPPRHTRLRLLVNKGFTPRMVERLHERVREVTRDIVDDIAARGECDFVVDVAAELPLQVIAEIMGVPHEDRHQLFTWSNQMIGSEDPEYAVSAEVAQTAMIDMFGYANELATYKRANPSDDIISVLLQAEVDGERLEEFDILMFCMSLLVAGNETTRNLVSHGVHALSTRPAELAALVADRSLVPRAVEEMLRWGTPIAGFLRTATREVEAFGARFAEGDQVLMVYAAANRDPAVFGDDAEEFRVSRDASGHVAFGFGEHFCLGAVLARMEARIAFEEILARFARIEPAGPIERLSSNVMRGVVRLPVVPGS